MFRSRFAVLLAIGGASTARAHPPDGDATIVDQLSHQLLALHHLPGLAALSALLLAGGVAIVLRARSQRSR